MIPFFLFEVIVSLGTKDAMYTKMISKPPRKAKIKI